MKLILTEVMSGYRIVNRLLLNSRRAQYCSNKCIFIKKSSIVESRFKSLPKFNQLYIWPDKKMFAFFICAFFQISKLSGMRGEVNAY